MFNAPRLECVRIRWDQTVGMVIALLVLYDIAVSFSKPSFFVFFESLSSLGGGAVSNAGAGALRMASHGLCSPVLAGVSRLFFSGGAMSRLGWFGWVLTT